MGDNDFTAGDPWGLPIEDSEETEIEVARQEDETSPPHHEVGLGPEEEPEPEDGYVVDSDLEDGVDLGEDEEDGDGWSATPEDVEPMAEGDEAGVDEVHEAEEETSENQEDEYTFKAPSRTPLSQMIAAAQSVVSSVQGNASEDIDEADEKPSQDEEPPFADEAPTEEAPLSDLIDAEPIGVPAYPTLDQAAVDDDLPEEPPSWMIIDTDAEGEPSALFHTEDAMASEDGDLADGDQSLPPIDIEASIAELATPETARVPFAEDRFEMPGEEEPESEDDFGVVDMDSSPGVYSELHDLAGQDEQAEAILQEAAEAFGRSDPTAIEPIEEVTEDLLEEPAPAPEDIDSYADALATQLGTEDTTIEPIEEVTDDLLEVEQAGLVDSDAVPYLSEDELGSALAGIADASPEDDLTETDESVELTEPEEPVAAGWWEAETPATDESGEPIESVVDEATIDAIGVVGWDEPSDDEDVSMENGDASQVTHEAAAVIDSSVEWGTRYREAHQGWVEDDEGRSTWRPIVTSGESVAGWDIDIYLGLVSGDISIDPVSTEAVASEVAAAREGAVRRMLDEGLARGAHAIVGVTFSIQDVAGTVLVGASGVAVTLRTPA